VLLQASRKSMYKFDKETLYLLQPVVLHCRSLISCMLLTPHVIFYMCSPKYTHALRKLLAAWQGRPSPWIHLLLLLHLHPFTSNVAVNYVDIALCRYCRLQYALACQWKIAIWKIKFYNFLNFQTVNVFLSLYSCWNNFSVQI